MSTTPLTLNLIGAGRVGRTLAALWQAQGCFIVQDVLTRSAPSAQEAVVQIGGGRAVTSMSGMRDADVWLLACPDTALSQAGMQMAEARSHPSVAWHCSGFLPASVLRPLQAQGWSVASAHPALSFARPEAARTQFPGTACALEGDARALSLAHRSFSAIGGQCFTLQAADKPFYHGAAVLASNFTPVLQAAAIELWRGCGMPEALITPLWQGFVRHVADNLLRLGPVGALTGPAARGDQTVVQAQTQAMAMRDPVLAQAYIALSTLAGRLARDGEVLAVRTDTSPVAD